MPDRRGHPPYLTIAAFSQYDFYPRSRHGFAEADGRIARRQTGVRCQKLNFRRSCPLSLDHHAPAELPQGIMVRDAFHLYPIGARMLEPRIGKPVLQSAIISEQHETFTVMIKTAARIDVPYGNKVPQTLSLARKLAEHSIGLMKKKVAEGHTSAYATR